MRLVWWEREMRERLCCRSGRSIGVRDLRWKTTASLPRRVQRQEVEVEVEEEERRKRANLDSGAGER